MKIIRINKVKGISLLELLIVIGIIGLIASLGMNFFGMSGEQLLKKETDVSLSYIERARLETINSSYAIEHGIKFASTSITLFPGKTYSEMNASNTVFTLNPKIYVKSVDLENEQTDLYFEKMTGKPSTSGTITFSTIDNTYTKQILINGTGLSEVQ